VDGTGFGVVSTRPPRDCSFGSADHWRELRAPSGLPGAGPSGVGFFVGSLPVLTVNSLATAPHHVGEVPAKHFVHDEEQKRAKCYAEEHDDQDKPYPKVSFSVFGELFFRLPFNQIERHGHEPNEACEQVPSLQWLNPLGYSSKSVSENVGAQILRYTDYRPPSFSEHQWRIVFVEITRITVGLARRINYDACRSKPY